MASFLFLAHQWLDANGTVYAGAKANIYLTGTTTTTPSYQDSALTTPHTNPVVADASGRFAPIYLDQSITYKVVFTDSGGTTIQTVDPVKSELGTANTALSGLTPAANKVPYFTGASSAALADFPAYGRSLVATASEAGFKALVNLEIGTDVESYTATQSQATWEAGVGTNESKVSPAKIAAAISALATDKTYTRAVLLTPGDTSWVAPYKCNVQIHAIGPSGGAPRTTTATRGASGSGAGAHVIKTAQLAASATLTLSIGTGGAASASDTAANAASGPTTVTDGASISLSAGAGAKGQYAPSGTAAAAAGGTGTGGDYNYSGGSSGAATVGGGVWRHTGGGGVGIFADGGSSGANTSLNNACTGGGGQEDSSDNSSTPGVGLGFTAVAGGMAQIGDGAGGAQDGGDFMGYGGGVGPSTTAGKAGKDGCVLILYTDEIA